MDKIREFLKSLKIEEKEIKLIRNKVFRGDLSLWSWFYDCDLDV